MLQTRARRLFDFIDEYIRIAYNLGMEESITRLEMKTAFMEDTLLTLNTLVVEQQKQIDALTAAVQKLEARLGYLIEMEGEGANADQRPPHY